HPARQARAERKTRKLQRQVAGRMLERELVRKSVRRAAQDRGVADRVQPRTAAQQSGLSHADRVRSASPSELLWRWCGARGLKRRPLAPHPTPAQGEDGVNINSRIQNCAE